MQTTDSQSPYFLGVDLGSSSIKVVALDEHKQVLTRILEPTGLILEEPLVRIQKQLANQLGPSHPSAQTIATGYGRRQVGWANSVKPEIICHARGVFHSFGKACTLIDIGGQDNKVIHMDEKGHVTNFRMNSKCAAGTGAFLEEIAAKAQLDLGDLHELATLSTHDTAVNSYCTVFAMTEVLKRIMGGEKLGDIARGIYVSVADRIREIYCAGEVELVLTGGVVENNPLLLGILEEKLGRQPHCPERPQFTGALGAALIALECHQKPQQPVPDTRGVS